MNNNLSNQLSAYKKSIEGDSKIRQLLTIYEELFKCVAQVKEGIVNGDYSKRQKMVDKFCMIIETLYSCLDFDQGKEAATALESFYKNIYVRLLQANVSKNIEDFDKILADIQSMTNSWREVEKQIVSGQA